MNKDAKILEINLETPGLTYLEIANKVGVSRQRVHQVLKKNNVERVKRESVHEKRANIIRPLFMKNLSYREISEITSIPDYLISEAVCQDYEMKTAANIRGRVFLFETIKLASVDWISGMTCEQLCQKYSFGNANDSKPMKSAIVHQLRSVFGEALFPKRNASGVENILEIYEELKSKGKTNREIFEIVGGYKNEESLRSTIINLKKALVK